MERRREVMQDGSRSLILFAVGRKYAHAVAMGDVVHVVKVELGNRPRGQSIKAMGEGLYMGDLRPAVMKDPKFPFQVIPYPIKRAARTYLRSDLRKTPKAAKVLRGLLRKSGELADVGAVTV